MEDDFERSEQENVTQDSPAQDESETAGTVDLSELKDYSEERTALSEEKASAENDVHIEEKDTEEQDKNKSEEERQNPPYFDNILRTQGAGPVPAYGGSQDRPTPPPHQASAGQPVGQQFYRPAAPNAQGYPGYAPAQGRPTAPAYGVPQGQRFDGQQAPYSVPDVNGGRISYSPAQPAASRKQKKSGGKGWIAILVAACVLLSFGAGFLGAYVAGVSGTVRTTGTGTSEGSQSTVIRQVESSGDGSGSKTSSSSVYADVVSSVADSVVEVYTEFTTTGWFRYILSGGGSGVIISDDGYIITNNHVVTAQDDITPADSIKVRTRSGEEYPATIVGKDADADIAVIKIEATGLTSATFGNSDELAVGDEVIAIGNPLGELGGTVTNGIISALARDITVEGNDMTLLQTNTAINPGNSGGGLFNLKGELIGIVNAVSDSSVEGISFAIPGNEALNTAKMLMEYGYVTGKPIIGVTLYNVDSAYKAQELGVNAYGVYIYEVKEGYNDDVLRVKDRILAVDGVEVATGDDVIDAIKKHSVGEKITLTVYREGEITEVEVTCYESGGDA